MLSILQVHLYSHYMAPPKLNQALLRTKLQWLCDLKIKLSNQQLSIYLKIFLKVTASWTILVQVQVVYKCSFNISKTTYTCNFKMFLLSWSNSKFMLTPQFPAKAISNTAVMRPPSLISCPADTLRSVQCKCACYLCRVHLTYHG